MIYSKHTNIIQYKDKKGHREIVLPDFPSPSSLFLADNRSMHTHRAHEACILEITSLMCHISINKVLTFRFVFMDVYLILFIYLLN